jgi:soluble lytic murein transglycosylase-like protein
MDPTKPASLKQALAACVLAAAAVLSLGVTRTLSAQGPVVAAIDVAPAPDPARMALVAYLADRYQRDPDRVQSFVDVAHAAAEEWDLDPLLVLAVISVESRFNPTARSGYGATGLMQVVPRFHREKLAEHGGDKALLDPHVNIQVGTQILKESLRRSGSLAAGLQRYAGWQDEERRYARKVMSEKERLRRVVRLAQEQTDREGKSS